ncbi:MAG: hypothetical protein U5P41_16210 [Gammaproteobacteria bacterium]|nr:hypothetical protein [Gammaproteobacteria bacterium]
MVASRIRKLRADWFERAADNNHLAAFYEFGDCYFTGEGRKQDLNQALYLMVWPPSAARHRPSINWPGFLQAAVVVYGKIPSVPTSICFWPCAGDLGQAPLLRDSLEAELSEEQLQRAQEFALKLLARQSRSEEG